MNPRELICSLTDSDDYRIFCNQENEKYIVKISRKSCEWYYYLCDMVDFYENTDIKVLLNIENRDIQFARKLYRNHRYDEKCLRSYEPKVLVHSTPIENLQDILQDNELKCWNLLRAEKTQWENEPIGAMLGDLEDFSNYIMLGDMNFNSEIIVASKQKKAIDINTEQIYMPGARFYFDAEKMAMDGLLLRDGEHIKVESKISLEKYLIWYSTAEKLGIDRQTTPRIFFEESNKKFVELFQQYATN